MTPESRTSYAEESPQPRTHTSIFGVTTVKFEHGPLQFTFSSHEPPLVQFEANPRGGRSLELQYRRVRLKFELSTPPDGSSYEEHYRPEGYPYREDGHFYREGEEEEETKITCTALQEEGYDLPAEIAVDFRMPFNFSISNSTHHHPSYHHHHHDQPHPLPRAPPAPLNPPYQYSVEEEQRFDATKAQLVGVSNLLVKLPDH